MPATSETSEAPSGIQPIGYVRSCFREKFGTPRQPGLVSSAHGEIRIQPPYHRPHAFTQLEQFSHIWVIFLFHQAQREDWKPTVRPPRLGGNQRLGVFASRSPFRPNPIGLSPLRLERIEYLERETRVHVSGLDLVDGTPVLDIKPYLPYVDAIPEALGGYANEAPTPKLAIAFEAAATGQLEALAGRYPGLRQLITETIAADPRPAYMQHNKGDTDRTFGVRLYDLNIRWRVNAGMALIIEICQV